MKLLIPLFRHNFALAVGISCAILLSIATKSLSVAHATLLILGVSLSFLLAFELVPRCIDVGKTKRIDGFINLSGIVDLGMLISFLLIVHKAVSEWLGRDWEKQDVNWNMSILDYLMLIVPFAVKLIIFSMASQNNTRLYLSFYRGDYEKALCMARRGIQLHKTLFGYGHYSTSVDILNHASISFQLGRMDKINLIDLEYALKRFTESNIGYRYDLLVLLMYVEMSLFVSQCYVYVGQPDESQRVLRQTLAIVATTGAGKSLDLFTRISAFAIEVGSLIARNNIESAFRQLFGEKKESLQGEVEKIVKNFQTDKLRLYMCRPLSIELKPYLVMFLGVLPTVMPFFLISLRNEVYVLIIMLPLLLLIHILDCWWDIVLFDHKLIAKILNVEYGFIDVFVLLRSRFKVSHPSLGPRKGIHFESHQDAMLSSYLTKSDFLFNNILPEYERNLMTAEINLLKAESLSMQIDQFIDDNSNAIKDGRSNVPHLLINDLFSSADRALKLFELIKPGICNKDRKNNFLNVEDRSKRYRTLDHRYRSAYAKCLIFIALAYARFNDINSQGQTIEYNFQKAKELLEIEESSTYSKKDFAYVNDLSLYIGALSELSFRYLCTRHYRLAETRIQEATTLSKLVSTPYTDLFSERISMSSINLVFFNIIMKKPSSAIEQLKISQQSISRVCWSVISVQDDIVRRKILSLYRRFADVRFGIIHHFSAVSSSEIPSLFEDVLQYKAVSLDIIVAQRERMLENKNKSMQEDFKRLNLIRSFIAQKYVNGLQALETLDEFNQNLMNACHEKQMLEQSLAARIPEMNIRTKLSHINATSIHSALPKGSALVEFAILYDPIAPWIQDSETTRCLQPLFEYSHSSRYVAFVLTEGNRKDIRMYVIGDKDAIDKQILDFRSLVLNEMYSQAHSNSSDVGDPTAVVMQERLNAGILLRKVLYDPLLDCLGERRQIFIVPDGELAQFPFEILSTDGGGHLIDRHLISYLSSSRDILRFGSVQNYSLSNPIVIADPDFDYGKETCLSENNYGMPANINLELEMDLYNIEFSRLEGSRLEGIEIANLLNVEPWLAGNALKSKVQSISSPFILHIASYGYYINDFQIRTTSDNLLNQVHTQVGLSNPFLRTGIALAGANWKSKNFYPSTEAGNGILTAEEFSGLALNGTELVILSACKTGLGDTPRGEGVLGFRQAVDMAGAKTLVMSLWNIPDKQTKQLMLMLYKRLSLGEGKAEALRNSQLALKEKYRAPYFWGGFICQGEVAPILHNLPTPLRDNISEE